LYVPYGTNKKNNVYWQIGGQIAYRVI